MITGGGKFSWLKPGVRRPADERPLIPCWGTGLVLTWDIFHFCWIGCVLVMWDEKTGREMSCTSNAVPCWVSQHCTVIFLSSSCPCLTLHRFYVPVRSNRVAQSDRNVCFAFVNGHCLWFTWFTVLCCRNNCLVWRRVVGVGDLTCLANL